MPNSSIFGATPRSAIRVAYIDPERGLVEDVSINSANRYAELNPGTVFIFRDGRRRLRYLTIREVNQLTTDDINPPAEECSNEPIRCGEPRIQFWGGGGLGAAANPIVSSSGSLIAVDLVRGGHGYQFAPFAAARDSCNIGSGAVLEPRIGIVTAETETFDEIEEYEIEDETGELPREWGEDGQDLGAWNPDDFTGTERGGDPISRQIEQYLRILRQIENPFWTSRKYSPRRITAGTRTYSRVYPVTHQSSETQRRSVDVGGTPTNSQVRANSPDNTTRSNQLTAEIGFSVSRQRFSSGSLGSILRSLNITEVDFRNGLEVILTPTGSSGGRTIEITHGVGNSGSTVRRNHTIQRGVTYTVTARLNTHGRTLIRRILSEALNGSGFITEQLSRSPGLTLRSGSRVVTTGDGNKLTVDVSSQSGFDFGSAESAIRSLGISINLSSGQGIFTRDSSSNITYRLDTSASPSSRASGLINTQGNQPISTNTSQSAGGIKFITQNNRFYLDAREVSGRVSVNLRFLVADTRRGQQGYAALRFEVPGTPIVFDRRQDAVTLTNGTYNRTFTIDGGRLYGPISLTGASRGSTQSLSSANTISSYDPGTSQIIRSNARTGQRSNRTRNRNSTTQTRRVDRDFDISLTSASTQVTETRRTWNDFMNSYAVCPVPASNLRGSDNAGILFSIEWEVNFPFDGDYIFRGCRDNEARLYIDDQFVSNLQNFNEEPQALTRRITRGNHSVRVDLLNTPQYENVVTAPPATPRVTSPSSQASAGRVICHAAGGSGGRDDSPVRTGGRVVVGNGGAGQGSDDDDRTRRGGGAGLRGGGNAGRSANGANGVTINGTSAATNSGYGFGGMGSSGLTLVSSRFGGRRSGTISPNQVTSGGDGRAQVRFNGRTREYGPGNHEFVVPAGVTSIEVRCIGGGGSGFLDNNGDREGSGGAGGAFAYATSQVTPGDRLRIVVGAGGRVPTTRGSQNGGDTLIELRGSSRNRTAASNTSTPAASSATTDIAPRPVFDTVSYIGRANRPLWRINPEANGSSDHMGRYGVLPFNIRAQESASNSYAGTHTILWENVTFPVDGNYTINITVDDNVTLYIGNRGSGGRANDGTSLRSIEAGGEEVVIRKQGFSRPSTSTGTSRYVRFFRAGSYRIRADLEQISGRNLSQGNPMALAINIETAYTETRVQRSLSWQQNPFGVALTIEAPEPPVPQEPPTEQLGRCPNNPIWSTRFPGASERWYPVRYTGAQTPNPTPAVPSTSSTAASSTSASNRTASSAPRNSAQASSGSTQRVNFTLSRSSINDLRNTVALIFTPRSGNGEAIRFTNDIVRNRTTNVSKTLRRNVAYTVSAEFTSAASRNRIAIPLLNSPLTIRRSSVRRISVNIGRVGDIAGTDLVIDSPSGAGTFTQSRSGTIEYEIVGSGPRAATTTNTRTNTSSSPNRARFINQNGQIFLDARGISGRATVEFEFTVRDTREGGGGYAARSFSIPGTPINFQRQANRNTRDGTGEASRSFTIEGGRLYGPVRLTGAARGSSTQLRSETLLSSFDPGTTTRIRQNNGRLPTEGDRLDFNIRISRTRVSQVTPPQASPDAPTPASENRRSGTGWGQFMNRYALSPVPPLLTLGSDRSGITFTNSWQVRIPFTGQYAVKGCADNRGRILIDGNEVAQMDGFRNDNPTVHRVSLTQGTHTITAEVFNQPQTTTTTSREVIFSTRNWPRPESPAAESPRTTRRVICQAGGGSGGRDDSPVRNGGRVIVGNGGAGQGSDDDDRTRRGGGAGLRGGGNAGRGSTDANGVTINGLPAGSRSGYGFGGNGSSGLTLSTRLATPGSGNAGNLGGRVVNSTRGSSSGGNGRAQIRFNGSSREYGPGTHEFVIPSGVTNIEVRCIGGGGSGFLDNDGDREGSGGAGGAFAYATSSVNQGDRLRIVVGAGGVAPTTRGSRDGGDTIVEVLPAAVRGSTARAAQANATTAPASDTGVSYEGARLLQSRYTNRAWGEWMNQNNVTLDFSGVQPAQTERINGYDGPGIYLDLRDIRGSVGVELKREANESGVNHGIQFRGIGTINESDRQRRTFNLQGGRVYGPITPTARVNGIGIYIGNERVGNIADSGSRPDTEVVVEEGGDDWDDFVVSTSRGRFIRLTSGEVTQRPANSPPTSIVGDFTLRWNNVNFPETGQYTIRLQSDDDAILKINNNEIRRTGASFRGEPTPFFATVTAGRYPIEVVLTNSNNGENPNTNPCGVSLEIVRDVSRTTTAATSWQGGNPVGISAVLIAPPCPRPTGGRGVVVGVDVIDPGNNYEPPAPNSPTYPVTLQVTGVNVVSPGINHCCGIDTVRLVPDNGAVLRYTCESFGRITNVFVESPGEPVTDIPRIEVVTNTGVGFDAVPVVEVVRDPIGIGTDRIIQVTDLVGLKQTGYIDGRPYYGAVFFEDGVPYAGYYRTAGTPVRVYATLQESITGRVTTPPSAIQRSGTDITGNDPRLNIPGTPENLI